MPQTTDKTPESSATSRTWSDAKALDDAAARGFGYTLLRRFFIEVATPDLFEAIATEKVLDFFPYADVNSSVRSGIDVISAYVEGATTHDGAFDAEVVADMASDYLSLFDIASGKGHRVAAPPIEAIYTSDKRRLFQKETVQVRRAFEAYGLRAARFKQEPDDHLALELQFLAFLCEEFSKQVRKKDFAEAETVLGHQKDFLDSHPLKWIARFCDDVREHASTPIWSGIVDLLEGFLYQDSIYIEKLQPALGAKLEATGGTSSFLAGLTQDLEVMASETLGESDDDAYLRAIEDTDSSGAQENAPED